MKNIWKWLMAAGAIATVALVGRGCRDETVKDPGAEGAAAMVNESKIAIQPGASLIVAAVMGSSIEFYGLVQDRSGAAIEGANVEYIAVDTLWGSGTKYTGTSDARGLFSISRIKGAALQVTAWKDGFDGIPGSSHGVFSYGMPFDPQRDRPTPSKTAPAIFVLRKKVPAEPIYLVKKHYSMKKDGSPTAVDLLSGKSDPRVHGDLVVECWTDDQGGQIRNYYDWHCRISIPGGGLMVKPESKIDFEAPESGYGSEIEFSMPKGSNQWNSHFDGEYYYKLANGQFGRAKITVVAGGGHYFTLESYLNPSGSRNLEYSEAQRIKERPSVQ